MTFASPILNIKDIITKLNFGPYTNRNSRHIRVAVLDNGFRGYKKELGKSLPEGTIYHAGPIVAEENEEEVHGLVMAQLLAGILTDDFSGAKIPTFELHLYSTFGYSNFESAVEDVVKEKIDVVLYSQIWEYGGNFDGRGFINALVDKAVQAGVLWINAAGNFGQNTFNTKISINEDGWVRLPAPNDAVRVRCVKTGNEKCPLRAVLSWNDFKDDVEKGTDKDLDLILTDDTLKIVASATLRQQLEIEKQKNGEQDPNLSKYPREILQTQVGPGNYLLRVKARSQNFSPRDRLRIMISGEGAQLIERDPHESLPVPADNPGVVTVGANDTGSSSRSDLLNKPEIYTPSEIVFSEKEKFQGTSQAAAIVAAAAVIIKSLAADVTREKFIQLITRPDVAGALPVGAGLSLPLLQFAPTGPGCFVPVGVPYPWAAPLLQRGAQFVLTTAGIKLFTAEDPMAFLMGIRKMQIDDMIVATPLGFTLAPRQAQWRMRRGSFEVLQTPFGESVCGLVKLAPKTFLMPVLPEIPEQTPQGGSKSYFL